jgi:hypothetical protein
MPFTDERQRSTAVAPMSEHFASMPDILPVKQIPQPEVRRHRCSAMDNLDMRPSVCANEDAAGFLIHLDAT